MAAHLNMNQGSFSNYLNGHRPLHIGIAVGVYELMGIPVESYSKRLAAELERLRKAAVPSQENKNKESNVIAADFSSKPERGLTASGDLIIPHYDVRAAMGAGQAPADYVDTIRHLTLHNSYLKSRGVNYTKADNLAIITGFGQSMEGTIADGEPVIVDRGVTEFVGDGVYVFTWDNLLYIKRLQKASASEFDVISDNKLHKDRVVPVAEIIIHAKCLVAWNARKL